jgi:hypothetical protein
MKQLTISATVLLLSLFSFLFVFPDGYAQAQPSVSSVTLHQEGDGRERVRIKLEGTHTPKVYSLEGDKPRLICDFPGAGYAGLVKPVVRGGGTLVQRIRVGAHDPPERKVRIVLDIEPGRKYTYSREFSKEENILNILLVPVGPVKKPEKAVAVIEATETKQVVITGPKKIYRPAGETQPESAQAEPAQAEPAAEPQKPEPAGATATIAATPTPQPPEENAEVPTMSLGAATPSAPEASQKEQTAAAGAEQAAPPVTEKAAAADSEQAPAAVPEEATPAEDDSAEKQPAEAPAPPETEEQVAEPPAEAQPAQTAPESAGSKPAAAEDEPEPSQEAEKEKSDQPAPASSQPEAAPVVAEKPPEPATPAKTEAPAAKPQLVEVSYENSSSKGEMIFFRLSGFHPPEVTAEESETPQVHCEFAGMELGDEVQREIEARGAYVQKIVSTADAGKVRVSIDLTVGRDYDLRQVFFKEDNLFVLIVNTLDEESADGKGPAAGAEQDAAAGK